MTRAYWISSAIIWGFVTFRLTTTPQVAVSPDTLLQQLFMSGAHFFFFGLEAVFIYLSMRPGKSAVLSAVAFASVFGALIEFIQLGVPGRSGDPVDWILDVLGAFVFISLVRKYNRI